MLYDESYARNLIHRVYRHGPHLMTDEIIGYHYLGAPGWACEFSRGSGFGGETIFAMTVVGPDATGNTEQKGYYNRVFDTLADLHDYRNLLWYTLRFFYVEPVAPVELRAWLPFDERDVILRRSDGTRHLGYYLAGSDTWWQYDPRCPNVEHADKIADVVGWRDLNYREHELIVDWLNQWQQDRFADSAGIFLRK